MHAGQGCWPGHPPSPASRAPSTRPPVQLLSGQGRAEARRGWQGALCTECPAPSIGTVPTRPWGRTRPRPLTPGVAQIGSSGWRPSRGRLPCEAPAPGRPRCPAGSGRPRGASQHSPAPPGTSCSSREEGACPCPAPATPPPGGCLHSAPGEGRKARHGWGLPAIPNRCSHPRTLSRSGGGEAGGCSGPVSQAHPGTKVPQGGGREPEARRLTPH